MTDSTDSWPNNLQALKALITAPRAEIERLKLPGKEERRFIICMTLATAGLIESKS